jgi:two-component system, OmpR family, phosphate regulon response regulator PhoB
MKKSVVIVEDDVPIAEAQRLILEEHYTVHLTHNGEDGLKKVEEIKPDLVILDWMMPKMNGIDVCKAIRSNPLLETTKVVMVTAKNADQDEMHGMEIGADDYIMKPFEPIELLHIAQQVLQK